MCLWSLWNGSSIGRSNNEELALIKITAPLIPTFFAGCGGILGGFVRAFFGLLSPSFGNVMLVSDSEWIIIDKE